MNTTGEITVTNRLGQLARWCFTHRRRTLAFWVAGLIIVTGLSQVVYGVFEAMFNRSSRHPNWYHPTCGRITDPVYGAIAREIAERLSGDGTSSSLASRLSSRLKTSPSSRPIDDSIAAIGGQCWPRRQVKLPCLSCG